MRGKTLHLARRPIQMAVLSTLVAGGMASAQTTSNENAESPIEELVVIGTAGGKGISRDDASFAVTTIDDGQLEKIQAKSTADLLKSVPGIWSESSGGVAGANIDVRGLPGGGDAPFTSFSINGSPLYGFNTLSFFEGSTLFRIDETVASVEALRGGPNAVFAKGEPGATINFQLKEGGEETVGRVKYSTSDYDLQRIDAVISGKISEGLYYMVGGYTSESPGIRDAQFDSEKGEQVTAQITKEFDAGKVNVYARLTDDHGQWYLPISLNNPESDPGTFSQLGNATRYRRLQTSPDGRTQLFDFAEGRGWDGLVSGINLDFDIGGGYRLKNNFNYVDGEANTFGFVPSGSAVSVAAVEAVIDGPVTTQQGQTLNSNQFAQTYGHWVVLKDLESFSNDLSLSKTLADNHDLTIGWYQSSFSADDFWTIGNPIAVHNSQNGGVLSANITPSDIAAAGGDGGFMFGLASVGEADVTAYYLADSWHVNDQLTVELGVRYEEIEIDYQLDTGPGFPDGTRDMDVFLDGDEVATTAAVDYRINDELGVFVRYSDGFSWPHFDSIREGVQSVFGVKQLEGGIKYSNDWLRAYATLYRNQTDAFNSVVGSSVSSSAFETEATGVELEGELFISDQFSTVFGATLQSAEITASQNGNVGNTVLRQPDFQIRISPQYELDLGGGYQATLYGALSYVGDRYGDNANTVDLPSFEKIDLGVILNSDSGFFVQLHGDNVTDSDGITEGDPRNPLAPNGRPIFGRSVKLSIGYDF